MISSCCSAGPHNEVGLCPQCYEHCDWLEECPDCDGMNDRCETCGGEGYVEVED